jgi:glycosyltransferase involved in cell wall biosynthesis
MKILFVSLQGITKSGSPLGMTRVVLNILKHLSFNYIYFIGHSPDKNSDDRLSTPSYLFYFILNFLKILLKIRLIDYKILRLIQEILFDLSVLFKLKKNTFLISTTPLYLSSKFNKILGGYNIYLAGNPNEFWISRILKKEEKKFNLKLNDIYTSPSRLWYIQKFIMQQDEIITQTNITYSSYLPYAKLGIKINLLPNKIIPSFSKATRKSIKIKKKIRFIFIAHGVWLKGLTYLIQAWNKLDQNNIELIVAGSIHKKVLEYILKNNFKRNIIFTGAIQQVNLVNFYSKGDICIVPSLIDDHPAIISEALSCGLPVIATSSCGSSDLIEDGINGFVIPPSDINSLSKAINWFSVNRKMIPSMSRASKKKINQIHPDLLGKNIAMYLNHKFYVY